MMEMLALPMRCLLELYDDDGDASSADEMFT